MTDLCLCLLPGEFSQTKQWQRILQDPCDPPDLSDLLHYGHQRGSAHQTADDVELGVETAGEAEGVELQQHASLSLSCIMEMNSVFLSWIPQQLLKAFM